MASFYNTTSGGGSAGDHNGGGTNNNNNSGFYNAGGGFTGQAQQSQQQQQQQPHQQFQTQYNNVNQWQAPPPQQQQQPGQSFMNNNTMSQQQQQQQQQPGQMMYGQQQQPQQQPSDFMSGMQQQASQMASGFVYNLATGKDPTKNIMDNIQNIADFGGGIPGLEYIMRNLRGYFAVDNRYVKRKMQRVLFPFVNKQWHRAQIEGPEMINYALPNTDVNAPDLYLPVMSLITYCLLCALCYGTAGQFNPEVIADVTTKCFITQILEVLIIRFGFFMMDASIPILDLFSYTGYKYLGLTVNMLCGILFGLLDNWGRTGFYISFVWTATAASYFMLKVMANNIPRETASTGPKREFMVLAFAASQAASMWFVSQTKFL